MDERALRRWFDEQTAAHAFSGVALAWRGGAPIFEYAGGLAHRGLAVPVALDSRFGVASVTKMATAIAALRFVERGTVRLDTPIVDLLPAEHRPAALTPAHTLRNLLAHTSGLANYFDDDEEGSFEACWDRIPTYRVRRPADLLPLFAELPAVDPPGTHFEYCDTNFVLVGLVLEALAGRPYAEIVAEEVFRPAGMADTAIEALDEDPPRLATGYVMDDGRADAWRANTFSIPAMGMPDGGMITTPADLARMIDALLDGRLLSPALGDAMTSPQGPRSDAVEQYGYGCELAIRDGQVVAFGHGGSDPGVSARVTHYPDASTTIAVACNQDRGSWAATVAIGGALGLEDPRTEAGPGL